MTGEATEVEKLARDVGARIRALRASRGVSLSALSLSSGLGKGTLSELERGKRNPTLDTLFAITTVFRVPLSSLLTDDALSSYANRSARSDASTRGSSVEASLLTTWDDEEGVSEVYRVFLNERLQLSDSHSPGVRETLTVLTGRVRVGTIDGPKELGPSESTCFPGDVPHQYQSLSGVATGLLVMFYPSSGRPTGQ
ncbi:helix-turn-helix domain-containing protein [Rhodococcus qingshengii]|uniref:helix-turn-helix domain-containing protein n=1 Tax=Rhodococcus qingshengii TaxID=334542 RepID=UPI0010A5BDDC|nr:helix-turn-helix domain-containing protein [Rhodococcus qingshengii]THJ64943.1 XRE family transcriptional regulator [Rhodococcus qingshengii]